MELRNKRVLVVGLGKSGLAAALFLRDRGARVTVSDTRSAAALAKEIPALMEAGIMVESGGHGLLTFRRQDLIVVSPGVPLETPEIKQAQAFGTTVIGELELASRFLNGPVVAITGSNGKTTTTTLVGKIFADAGLRTRVGGNIGLPAVELVGGWGNATADTTADPSASLRDDKGKMLRDDKGKKLRDDKETMLWDDKETMLRDDNEIGGGDEDQNWFVLEVSSFQLETTVEFKPRIAMVLNVTPDHLDRHGTFERYWEAKARITANQDRGDFLVLNAEDVNAQKVAAKTRAQIYWFSGARRVKQGAFVHGDGVYFLAAEGGVPEAVLPVAEIALKGKHNVENVLAAVCAARLAGTGAAAIRAAVKGFRAVEHRLELVRVRGGVEFYNDSKATNVDATVKAVESFAGGIHLILGGKDKDSDYSTMSGLLRERVRVVYTIGSAAEKIERQLDGVVKIVQAGTLATAVTLAAEAAVSGEILLLAPACSSFDQFLNYEERGRAFRDLVLGLDE